MSPLYHPIYRVFLLLLLATSLAACGGFQLRSADSVTRHVLAQQSISISGEIDSAFKQVLVAALIDAGATLQPSEQANIQLTLNRVRLDKTVSGYSAVRQVREFNHFIEVEFSATNSTPTPPTSLSALVRAERSQTYSSRYVLGMAEEERMIQTELRQEAARLLALRLIALRP